MLREQTAVDGTSASGIVRQVSVNVGGPQVPSLIGEATKIRQRFRDAGYTPIPAEGKACRLPGWSKLVGEVLSDDFISGWEKKATWLNTGILCGAVRVIDKVLVWLRANASLPSCGCLPPAHRPFCCQSCDIGFEVIDTGRQGFPMGLMAGLVDCPESPVELVPEGIQTLL